MKKILIDSGPLIALFDSSDKYHQEAVDSKIGVTKIGVKSTFDH